MESILKTIKKQKIPINPAVVISNKPNARGLVIAKRLGVKTEIVDSNLGREFIKNLRPIKFKWTNGKRFHYGLSAQEVKDALIKSIAL